MIGDPCPNCGVCDFHDIPGPHSGGHYAKRVCGICERFLGWLPKPDTDRARRPAGHRELVKKFGRGFCEYCRRTEKELPAGEVLEGDHIESYQSGGEPKAENVFILCTMCHKMAHLLRTYLGHYHGRLGGKEITVKDAPRSALLPSLPRRSGKERRHEYSSQMPALRADRIIWTDKGSLWPGRKKEPYVGWVAQVDKLNGLHLPIKCPYGSVGDRLVFLSTWAAPKKFDKVKPSKLPKNVRIWSHFDGIDKPNWCGRSRPGRFMPKWMRTRMPRGLITEVRAQRVQAISEDDAKAEGLDVPTCARVFDKASGKMDLRDHFWIENDETGESYITENGDDFCGECAEKIAKRLGKKFRICGCSGMANESDGPAFCSKCGNPILISLTQYGVERELRIEDDPEGAEPQSFPCNNEDARIAYMIASGIGNLQEEHHGRLAQIGFATLWDSINSKKSPWTKNDFVWAITFKRIEP